MVSHRIHLFQDQNWANGKNLKTKVLTVIDSKYPFRSDLPHGKKEARFQAREMIDNYFKYGEMPLDVWWKKKLNRWFKTPKLSPSSPELTRSWPHPFREPELVDLSKPNPYIKDLP